MFNDISKPAPPLPTASLTEIKPGLPLLLPLSRRGHGPGVILLIPDTSEPLAIKEGVPSFLVKWAEEGYTVVGVQEQAITSGDPTSVLKTAVQALSDAEKCQPKPSEGNVGIVSYDPRLWNQVAPHLSKIPEIVAAVAYGGEADEVQRSPFEGSLLQHIAGGSSNVPKTTGNVKTYYYPKAASYLFAVPFQKTFHYNTEALSHTRNLTFLKPLMKGPYFDLETIWEEHTYYEFADRSVEHTMSTMVDQPYVNHVPTMTGGIGRGPLTNFYSHNFIFNNSADTDLELLSRTLGIDRIIDEFIFKFTHDRELDWLLPGVPPTNIKVEVPFTAVVNVRGDRLYHEHISWDQGTVLRQLGLLPEYLPYPYPVANGTANGTTNGTTNGDFHPPTKKMEYRVPVGGVEIAQKMRDRNVLPSNEMFEYKPRYV